jgi:hypothetical protein
MNNKIISIDTLKYYNDKISNYVDEKVSDAVDNLELDELNAILVDTDSTADDPIIPDYVTETELNTALSGKMDKVTLAKVATSGSYNDLSNKPTIPAAVTESTVSGWGFTKNAGTYSKPSGGIPKSDLASAVQTSLGKADTALQSYTEQYKGTVTGVKINGTTKNPSSGVVDLGTVITAHQDISGKQDKLVSGTNIKTINGTSLLGSGNIVISGGGGSSSGSGAYSEVNHGTSDTTFTLTPNTFHVWDEVASLTLDFGSETAGVANEYLFQFTSGATATSLTLPDDIKWANDSAPTITENMIYQVSILKGLASVLEFKNIGELIENKLAIISGMAMSTFTFEYPVTSDVTLQYSNIVGGNGTSIIKNGTQSAETDFEPGNENIVSVIISPSSDNTYIYTR